MILLAVNFHYVAERPHRGRAIFPVSIDELAEQAAMLARSFELVGAGEVAAAVRDGRPLPAHACAITFDDGLRSQFELALPVLERLGAPATFFVPTRPLVERRALTVHKLHHLREALDERAFREAIEAALARAAVDVPAVSDEDAARVYRYDAPDAARVKFLLNMALPEPVAAGAVDAVFAAFGESDEAFCRRIYMEPEQVRELAARGALGSHGHAHLPLGRLPAAAIRADLERAAEAFESLIGERPAAVSYPYGSPDAATPDAAQAAAAVGHVVGFTMERAFNRSLEQPLLLARIDANDTPAGRSPLFRVDDAGSVHAAGMTGGRSVWLAEVVA